MNDIEKFLEDEKEMLRLMLQQTVTEGYFEGDENWIKDHDTHLINFLLDTLQRKVEKKKQIHKEIIRTHESLPKEWHEGNIKGLEDISTIINSFKR